MCRRSWRGARAYGYCPAYRLSSISAVGLIIEVCRSVLNELEVLDDVGLYNAWSREFPIYW